MGTIVKGPSVKRILLVDDDVALLGLLREWLVSAGHSVVSLSDFHAAKNYLALNIPDMIVTDVRLGAYNGLQLAISAKTAHPDVVTIVLTGFDDNVIRADAAAAGAHYLVKPVIETDFLRFVRASFQGS